MMTDSNNVMSGEVFHRFLILYRYLRQQARQMNSRGIKPPQFAILRFLLESGSATVGEVQAYIYRSASTTSTMIAQLEEVGYVTRTRSQEDNRVVIVELTSTGRDTAQNMPITGLPLLRRRLKTLPQERLLLINEALAEIMQLMEVTDTE
jgi:DNA-binding MarR family transcriptional regulator